MYKLFSVSIAIFLLPLWALAEGGDADAISDLKIGENFRIFPSNTTQTEVFISVHPSDPDIMFSSANTIVFNPFFISEGVYATTDGGNSWFGNDSCLGEPIQFHGGDPGIAIDKNGTFILTRLGRTPFAGLYSHFSTDMGRTWSFQQTVTTDDLERAAVATDGNPLSNYYGRTYAAWVRFTNPFPMFFAATDDGAASWSSPRQINNPTVRNTGGDIDIDTDGNVAVCWAGVTSVSPFTEIFCGFAKSTDGGDSWTVQESAFNMNGIQGLLPEKQNIRVNGQPRIAIDKSGGSRHGWIYIITTQKNMLPAGSDPDIILNRSTDGGSSWSAGIRVNQDALNNGKIQYFPAIEVDNGGGVNIVYYDDRNTSSDSSGVFLSRSLDGGETWHESEISDHRFKPTPIGGLGQGYQGDNIDIAETNNTLWPVWMDNSSGVYQLWTAPLELSAVQIEPAHRLLPETFDLRQNAPNPFNPSTVIQYRLATAGRVTLTVYDVKGKVVENLVNSYQQAGEYSATFAAYSQQSYGSLPSGIYFYKLTVGGNAKVRSMLLLK